MQGESIEYQVKGNPWRINQGKQFLSFFVLEFGHIGQFHFWAESRPDLAAPWVVTRLFFGIEPLVQSTESDADLYGGSLSVDEIADMRKCEPDDIRIDLQAILAAWKVFKRNQPIEEPPKAAEPAAAKDDYEPPSVPIDIESSGPLTAVQADVLRYRGFNARDFEYEDRKRSEEDKHRELQALHSRLVELKRVFDEPMAKELGRQALINELLLRRIDRELLKIPVQSPKFGDLRKTKNDIEATILKQWSEIEKVCPFIKGAVNKMTAIGAFSDMARGYMEWKTDGTKTIIDGMFTNYEIQVEMRESVQLDPHYRPGWVAAMVEARAGLFDPNFRRSISNAKCQVLDMAYKAAARAYNERYNIRLPDLLKDGPEGEYPEIILPQPADGEEAIELRDKENVDDQLAAEASEPIELDQNKPEETHHREPSPYGN